MTVTVSPLTPAVGAEIGNVDLTVLTADQFAQIEGAWHRYYVLLFRRQRLTDDHLIAFSRRFGELDPPPNQEHGRQSPPGYPDVYVVSNVRLRITSVRANWEHQANREHPQAIHILRPGRSMCK